MLKINRFPTENDFAQWGLYLLAFLMGIGFLRLEIGALVLVAAFFWKTYISQAEKIQDKAWAYLAGCVLGLFLFFYGWDYLPYKPQSYLFEAHYFIKFFAWSVLAFLLPLACHSVHSLFSLVWYLALGVFVYAFVTVVATLWLLPPPYYGQVIVLLSFVRGDIAIGNSPGISNLLCFVPIVFWAGLLLDEDSRPRGMILMGFIASLFAVFAAIQLQQRTFFLLVLVLQPVLIGLLLMVLKRYYTGLMVFSICLICPILLSLEGFFGINILPRKLDANLLTDARVEMFRFWFSHVWKDPWSRVEVGPAPWDSLYWFHNFFADVHRLSGLKPVLAACAFFGLLFIRTIYLFWLRPAWGAFVLAVAFPTFMIANTSVVPEGERQPFLLLVLLYSICECLLWQIRKEQPSLPASPVKTVRI